MKKFKIACLLLAGGGMLAMAGGLCACDENPESRLPDGDGSSTLVTDKAPNELSAEDAVYAFLQKQTELSSYKITAEGSAVASLAGYKQDIHNITFKNGEDYLNQAESDSVLVKMKHQSFSKGGKVVYRDSFDGEMKVADKDEYKKIYGFTADDVTLGGYIVNPKTLRYANLEKTEGDTFTYYLRLAGDQSVLNGSAVESATAFTRLQAKAYGSLDNLPAFSDVDLRLTVKKDWTPVSYSSYCTYDCKKIFNMSVEQTLSCTYSDVNGTVEIPDVVNFNAKLGSTPSKVEQTHPQEEPFVELLSALGNSLGDEGALEVPVSLAVTPFSFETEGALKLRLTRDALERGDFLDALSLRFDLDLSPVPLLGSFCNFLTVRYPGDGLLLLQLGSGAGEQSKILSTYTLDLADTLPAVSKEMFDLQTLKTVFEANFTLEKTDSGFTVSLKEDLVKKLNDGLGGVVSSLEEKLGDTHGYIRSLLQATFTSAQLDLAGGETIQAVGCTLDGTPAENVTKGEKIALSFDVSKNLLSGMISKPFLGEIDLRLEPSKLFTGDLYGIATASLSLDLEPASPLLDMLGMVAGFADLPAFLTEIDRLELLYPGDGTIAIALLNKEGNPVFVQETDLKEQLSPSYFAAQEENGGIASLLSLIHFQTTDSGIVISLGEEIVSALDALYNTFLDGLIADAVESAGGPDSFTGSLAENLLRSMLGANISGVEFFLGKTEEGALMFDFAIKGKAYEKTETERLLGLTLTHQGELSEEERNALLTGAGVKPLEALKLKAQDFETRLQALIDGMDITDGGYDQYVKDVTALQTEIEAEEAGVKSLMSNKSYLETKTYNGKEYTVLLLTAELYHDRVEQFKATVASIEVNAEEAAWDALNALYEKPATTSGISIPAIKGNELLEQAIGEEIIENYLQKRSAHETQSATKLTADIVEAKAAFEQATDREGWTEGLTKIVTEFKPVYDKLPADLKAGTGYQDFVVAVYNKNIDELTKVYEGLKTKFTELTTNGQSTTLEAILEAMKELSGAYAWGFGYDYWESNSTTKKPWGTWVSALKPTWLSGDDKTALDAKVTNLNNLNTNLTKNGETMKAFAKACDAVIKTAIKDLKNEIWDCRTVVQGQNDKWDFEQLDEKANKDLLERIHGIRFMLSKLPAITWGEGDEAADLTTFTNNLSKWETALNTYLSTDKEA